MATAQGLNHKRSGSASKNSKAQLANAYNELGKELSSTKIRVIGNYTLGKVIGEGAYGKVRMGTHRLTSSRVAIKQIPKALSSSLTREIHHHRQLHHPHVTQMYEVIATESSIWIVTELCCGGELFDYLAEKGRLGEDETKIMFGQLCLAVAYLHDRGIVHRDLKLENVLLDERCHVKLGDFGFTREFDRGAFMETFCGTTGYASPEMLQGRKYLGPEVDIWSLGVILYTLLTGTLPFDDDDESVMRNMIINENFEDPEWLSTESRDLIKNILQKDPTKRLTIPQILSHPWFTARPSIPHRPNSSLLSLPISRPRTPSPPPPALPSTPPPSKSDDTHPFSSSSDSTSSDVFASTPTTPDDISSGHDHLDKASDGAIIHRNPSESTIRKFFANGTKMAPTQPETVVEEDSTEAIDSTPVRHTAHSGSGFRAPPYPTRTPARTKRRSVSSTLSDPDHEPMSPISDKPPTPLPLQDFSSLLNTPAPIIFSTPLERELLNNLSVLGCDTGQIVHSVLSDACDAAGAMWWMLRKKAEKKAAEEGLGGEKDSVEEEARKQVEAEIGRQSKKTVGVQTEAPSIHGHAHSLSLARSAPQLGVIPATPTVTSGDRPSTPTNPSSTSTMLSPSPTTGASTHPSQPSTPSLKDSQSSKGRKPRAGSVSIMQRATTALEAAGLVRKKSAEAVRDEKHHDREREKSKENERRTISGDEPRSSHGSSSSKLTKSPPPKAMKDATPSGPPSDVHELHHPQPLMGSPWVLAGLIGSRTSPPPLAPPTPASSPGDTVTSLPTFPATGKAPGSQRNRANLLTAFRLWFNEDRKGKRKAATPPNPRSHQAATPGTSSNKGSLKGRASNAGRFASRKKNRPHRHSISSRRSSSVNSRRSSGTSAQILILDSPHNIYEQVPGRRSLGSRTPNSERDLSSRPSSIRSFSMHKHRKSPSTSSVSSAQFRTASPMQKYHRRAGSGTSTRVVRQTTPGQNPSTRPAHMRSNSATSSIHSLASSRPTSFYEPSESEGQRTGSPFKPPMRRSLDDTSRRAPYGSSTFVAQKRQTPFMSPSGGYAYTGSVGRSSWKKSWGLEPPGWQSRSTHLPVEVLAISPAEGTAGIRDVFSGRTSLNLGMGDESDWVDEDDDLPAFAGGLGQLPSSTSGFTHAQPEPVLAPPPPPRASSARGAKRGRTPTTTSGSGAMHRQKTGHSPAERTSPIPCDSGLKLDVPEPRGGRRQLPPARSGPAFRGHAIQEEDEGEEE